RPRLFEPLGFENPTWVASPQGISAGAYGLMARTEEIARFGQLYLQKGMWKGRQLIPAAWVEQATALQTSNGSSPTSDWDQGYGYQFWRCRHHAYRGDGAFGQYCVVMPDQDAVVAITSGVKDMQAVLNIIWDKLLPAMVGRESAAGFSLSPRERAGVRGNAAFASVSQQLKEKLGHLEVRTTQGSPTSPLAGKILNRKFTFPSNDQKIETLALSSSGSGETLILTTRID